MEQRRQVTIPESLGSMSVQLGNVVLCADWMPPVISFDAQDRPMQQGAQLAGWAHVARTEREEESAALGRGRVIADRFVLGELALVREVYLPERGSRVAVRGTLENHAQRGICLGDWAILAVESDGLRLGDSPVAEWQLYCHGRHKNDHPIVVALGRVDANALLAAGVRAVPEDGAPLTYRSDPLALLKGGDGESGLLLGFTSELEHLATIDVTMSADYTALGTLQAVCEFDGCRVPPGTRRETCWLLLDSDPDHQRAIDDYAETVAALHGVLRPGPAPSVYCTWSFYGWDLTPQDMEDELSWFATHRWPIDVFQIDESWESAFGDWHTRAEWGDASVEGYAARIRELGYTPGLWTCPYLADVSSPLAAEHPEWMLRRSDGTPVIFPMNYHDNYVLDATHPEVQEWLEALYRRLGGEWGYSYHKFDFSRAIALDKSVRFHDPTATRAQAYRRGYEAIRRALGDEAYMLICGGLYLSGIGLADGQRAGSDVKSRWINPRADLTVAQNLLRTWMNRLWHQDPDSCVIRRRAEKRGEDELELTLGMFTDEEARTIIVNQYLGGGLICFTERMSELDEERAALYRACIPSLGAASVPADLFSPSRRLNSEAGRIPELHVTRVQPRAEALSPWYTVAIINWAEVAQSYTLTLDANLLGANPPEGEPWFLGWEFFERRLLGRLAWGDALPEITVPPHGTRVLRLTPWDGRTPTLLATDRHLSMGGVEIADWAFQEGAVEMSIVSVWREPFSIWLACPAGNRPEGVRLIEQRVRSGRRVVLRLYPKSG
ncbi:MAG: alpha-galactosidase [Chloroflexi bacterium]|nr:alpha-galactosidase [Chloroflexota bacterium]